MLVFAKGRTGNGADCRGRRHARLAAIAVVAGLLLISQNAVAEDWYLRGGIGLDWSGRTVFSDVDCSSTAPAALYGCGTGDDGAPYRSVGDFGTVPVIEIGLGYAAAGAL